MAIDTGKILKTSDEVYFKLTGEKPSDYTFEKVETYTQKPKPVEDEFVKRVPPNTEIVLNYRTSSNNNFNLAFGTALIPKKYNGISSEEFFGELE